jgi:hypothetical protein
MAGPGARFSEIRNSEFKDRKSDRSEVGPERGHRGTGKRYALSLPTFADRIPKEFRLKAQGCEARATLGTRVKICRQP